MDFYEEDDSWGTLYAMQKLENFKILEVQSQIVSEVTNMIAAAAKMGIKVEWIHKVIN